MGKSFRFQSSISLGEDSIACKDTSSRSGKVPAGMVDASVDCVAGRESLPVHVKKKVPFVYAEHKQYFISLKGALAGSKTDKRNLVNGDLTKTRLRRQRQRQKTKGFMRKNNRSARAYILCRPLQNSNVK